MSKPVTAAASSLSLTATGDEGAGAATQDKTSFRLMNLPESLHSIIFSCVDLGEQRSLVLTSKKLRIIAGSHTAYPFFRKQLEFYSQGGPGFRFPAIQNFFNEYNPCLNAINHLKVHRSLLSAKHQVALHHETFSVTAATAATPKSDTTTLKERIEAQLRTIQEFSDRSKLFVEGQLDCIWTYASCVRRAIEENPLFERYSFLLGEILTILNNTERPISSGRKKVSILSLVTTKGSKPLELLLPLTRLYNQLLSHSTNWFVPALLETLRSDEVRPVRPEILTFAAAMHFKGHVDTESLETFFKEHSLSKKEISALFTSGNINAKGVAKVLVLCNFLTETSSKEQHAIAEPIKESAEGAGAAGSKRGEPPEERKAQPQKES